MVEFDDPDAGNHVVILDGMTVETAPGEAIGIVSIAAIVSCSACLRRRILPVEEYRHGCWHPDSAQQCAAIHEQFRDLIGVLAPPLGARDLVGY